MDDKKIIINVGRQLGSGGRVIASMLAKDFGCKFYDKELLNLAAKESGFCETFFEQNDEQKGFLKSFFYAHMPFLSGSSFYSNKLSQESLFQFQSDAIRKAADEGSCVFVGRCADYVLRDYKNTASVFITADLDERVERVAKDCHENNYGQRKRTLYLLQLLHWQEVGIQCVLRSLHQLEHTWYGTHRRTDKGVHQK